MFVFMAKMFLSIISWQSNLTANIIFNLLFKIKLRHDRARVQIRDVRSSSVRFDAKCLNSSKIDPVQSYLFKKPIQDVYFFQFDLKINS